MRCWPRTGKASRSRTSMAARFGWCCPSCISGRAPNGSRGSSTGPTTSPASGKCAAITITPTRGRRNAMADWRLSLIHRRRLLRLFLFGLSTAAAVSGIAAGLKPASATSVKSGREKRTTMSAYDFDFAGIEGGALPLKAWRGKPILVVNTASFCGYTPQYTDLEKLWGKYKDRGLVVLGVPSNDFGQQEPGSAKEIKAFCETYDVSFPLTEK